MRLISVAHFLRQLIQKNALYFVYDGSDWALRWVAHYITQGVSECGLPSFATTTSRGFTREILHFADQTLYAFNANTNRSNHIFLTWFHGDPTDPAFYPPFEKLYTNLDAINRVVVSCSITKQQLSTAGLPVGKMEYIPLGVDLSRFAPPTDAMRQQTRRILGIPEKALCIGSFQKDGNGWGEGHEPKLIKGPDVFLDTIAHLVPKYANLFVLLTGPARGYIKHGLDRLGVPYIHHYLDDYKKMAWYYHAIDLYLITSRAEGGPKALLESWATGIPVISTRCGMPADLIQPGETGMLADIEDVVGLTEGIMELIDNSELRYRCRNAALDEVKHYSWSKIAKQHYEKLYQPLIKGNEST